jgi:thioredoxin-related protein
MANTLKFVATLILFFFLFLSSAKEVDIKSNLIATFCKCVTADDCPQIFVASVYKCIDGYCELFRKDPLPPLEDQ